MTKKMANPSRPQHDWDEEKLLRIEGLIRLHNSLGHSGVPWSDYLDDFPDHTLKAVYSMANIVRRRMIAFEKREYKRWAREQVNASLVRALADIDTETSAMARRSQPMPQAPTGHDEPIGCTSTARMRFAAEWRNRIAVQDITAAQFGDPLPGKSALDKRRAGIVDPPVRLNGNYNIPKKVTLATRPWPGTIGFRARHSSIGAPARSKPTQDASARQKEAPAPCE